MVSTGDGAVVGGVAGVAAGLGSIVEFRDSKYSC